MVMEMCNPILCDTVHRTIKDKLAMRKVSMWWLSHQLSDEHTTHQGITAMIEFLTLYDWEGKAFVQCIVTGDETGIHHYTSPNKTTNYDIEAES